MARTVLLVDDDTRMSGLTAEYLEAKGFVVTRVSNAIDGYEVFLHGKFDICILDVRMPMKSGFELAGEIRAVNKDVPIIFLTGETEPDKRIEGLMLGADDYLTKPFSYKELYLRIEAIFRRMGNLPGTNQKTFDIGLYIFEPDKRELILDSDISKLSEIESRLLEAFCRAPDGQVTREFLLTSIWQDEVQLKGRSLNVYITKLRKRLAADPAIEILNVHGSGYRMVVH